MSFTSSRFVALKVLKLTHFSKFQLETLLYIFYAMPKDALQAYAAEELYRREWRYHKEMKLWIKEEVSGPCSLATSHTILLTWLVMIMGTCLQNRDCCSNL